MHSPFSHIFLSLTLLCAAFSNAQVADTPAGASIRINNQVDVPIPPVLNLNQPVTAPLRSPLPISEASIESGPDSLGCFFTGSTTAGASAAFYKQSPLPAQGPVMVADAVTCFVPRSQGDGIVWLRVNSPTHGPPSGLLFIPVGDVGGRRTFTPRQVSAAVLMNSPDSTLVCELRSAPFYQPFAVGHPAQVTYRKASEVMCFRRRVPDTDATWYPHHGKMDRWYRYPPVRRS